MKAVIWCFVCNLALMFPVGAVLFTVQHLLGCLEGGGSPTDGFWLYVGFALAVLVLLFVLHWFQYASLYIATYRESANRRVSLAETLRRLPLSFFGNRDLSDLTSTMIADCSSLDQMFSHYVPQLFASIGSTLVIGVCMFACDWRMALAVLWVVRQSQANIHTHYDNADVYKRQALFPISAPRPGRGAGALGFSLFIGPAPP